MKGYLQLPLQRYKKGVFNHRCCCSSEVPHNESLKFKIVKEDHMVNERIFMDIEEADDGPPDIQQADLKMLKLPNDSRKKYFLRKREVAGIIEFLSEPDRKLLFVYGPQGVGKLNTTIKAIRFAAEHEMSCLVDGVFLIDLEEVMNNQQLY